MKLKTISDNPSLLGGEPDLEATRRETAPPAWRSPIIPGAFCHDEKHQEFREGTEQR